MATQLTWCGECGEDMHVNGGGECPYCGEEFCFNCLKEHRKYCAENRQPKDFSE